MLEEGGIADNFSGLEQAAGGNKEIINQILDNMIIDQD